MNVKGVQCCVVLFLMQNEGSVQDMRRNLIIKAFVLGAVGCTFTITGIAADVEAQDTHSSVNEQQIHSQDAARHEAVRSNWMDRTDVVVGVGMKHSEGSSSHQYHNFMPWEIILLLGLLINLNLQNSTSYTLRHYNL